MIRTAVLSLILTLFLVSTGQTQVAPDPQNPEGENMEVPVNWKVRLDHPGENVNISSNEEKADIYFVNMVPGWHITTGPAAIFWHPGSRAEGTYRAETVIHLFDPKGRNEAFGIFIGGNNLEAENQVYSYFLLRNSGEYLIKNREGNDTEIVKGWSAAPSMNIYADSSKSSVRNKLGIEVGEDEVTFYVNDETVANVPKTTLYTGGTVGLRINHRLNVHVEDLSVSQ